jgi:hypothetical protein
VYTEQSLINTFKQMCDENDSDSSVDDSEAGSECSARSVDLPKITPGDVTLDANDYMGCTECNEAPIGKGFDDNMGATHNHSMKRKACDTNVASGGMEDDDEYEVSTRNPNPKRRRNDTNILSGGMEDDDDPAGQIDEFIPIDEEGGRSMLKRGNDKGDMDDRGSPSPTPSHNLPVKKSEICWLCTFCMEEVAKDVTLFISSNISTIDTLHMASQIKDEILTIYPMAKGARKRDILRHIREHMLHPSVKMASIIRSLITVAESLRTSIHQRDPESDCVIMDLKSIDMYLKVLTQISNAYKMDSSKLLFSNPSKT